MTYVGAPYTVDFGDNYQPRVLLIEQSSKGPVVTSIKCTGPQKRLVELERMSDLKKVKGLGKGDILKVRLTITRAEHPNWPEWQREIREWGADNGYQVHTVLPVLVGDDRKLITKRKIAARDDSKIMQDYCRKRGIDAGTAKVGAKLMGEA